MGVAIAGGLSPFLTEGMMKMKDKDDHEERIYNRAFKIRYSDGQVS